MRLSMMTRSAVGGGQGIGVGVGVGVGEGVGVGVDADVPFPPPQLAKSTAQTRRSMTRNAEYPLGIALIAGSPFIYTFGATSLPTKRKMAGIPLGVHFATYGVMLMSTCFLLLPSLPRMIGTAKAKAAIMRPTISKVVPITTP
jgi:hypothetical protein